MGTERAETRSRARRALMWALLDYHAKNGRSNKWNTLGRPYQRGGLELSLGETFDGETRAAFERAFDTLRRGGLLLSDFGTLTDPGDWMELSTRGKRAVERRVLDALDEELVAISPRLVEMRDGAWASVESEEPDSLRQAADSGFELVSQALKLAADDEAVKRAAWFQPHPDAENGIGRDHRARWVMEQRADTADIDLCDMVAASARRLAKLKHARRDLLRGEVELALEQAEASLQGVLVPPSRQGRE